MTESDLGQNDGPAFLAVGIRLTGDLGAPLVVISGAVLSPDAAVGYAKAIFAAAATACRQSRLDVAGHG